MADVYLAKLAGNANFAKLSVIKRLKSTEEDDPEIMNMFADEARLSARLNHPSIVQTFEVGDDETGPFLVMEYIEGQPLGRIRSRAQRRGQTITRGMALKIVRETVGALAYAHNMQDHDGSLLKVVHRDVSPENIMVSYAGQTKLVDFGVAKTAASMSKTRAGVLKGKVAYMAPEQARSDENIDERVDVFAVGLILWELLTSKRMWEGMSEAKVFERLLDKEPLPRAKEAAEDLPVELDEICAKAIAKEKSERYATMHDLLDALERAGAKLDLRASDREIGQWVSTLFEVERDKVKALVASSMAKKEDSILPTDSTPTLEPSDPMLWAAPSSSGSLSQRALTPPPTKSEPVRVEARSDPSLNTTAGTSETKHDEEMPPLRKSPAKTVLAGLGLVAAIVIAVMVGKNMGGGGETNATPPPPTFDVPKPAPTPTPVETAISTDINIEIAVKPTAAKISLDGSRVTGNPYRLKTSRGSATHEVKVEADGYETRTINIAFDRDRTLDVSLNKMVYVPTGPAPVAAPKPNAAGSAYNPADPASLPPAPTAPNKLDDIQLQK